MNEAHYHLAVNHFPIIGTIFGFGILIAGLIMKSKTVKNVSYILFIITAIFAFASISTGGGAAGMVKGMPDITKPIIHKHAEIAQRLAMILYVLAVISLLGLYTNTKNHKHAKLISFAALIISGIAVYVGKDVGTTGGEIRHTEIRNEQASSNAENHEDESEQDDD